MKAPCSLRRFFGMIIARRVLFGLLFLIAATALPQTPTPKPKTSAILIQFVIATGDDDLRADSQAVAILQTSRGNELGRVVLKTGNQPEWAAGSIHSVTAPLVEFLHPASDIDQVTIQLIPRGSGLISDNWNIQSVGAVLLESEGQSATSLLSASGAPLARLTGSQATITLKAKANPLIVWSPKFDQIKDSDLVKTLRSDQERGWAAVLSAWKHGKSSDELVADATVTREDIEQQIAADQFFLERPTRPVHTAAGVEPSLRQPAPVSSTAALLAGRAATNLVAPSFLTGIGRVPHSTTCGPVAPKRSYVECDLAMRQQQLPAIQGLIDIAKGYASVLPPPATKSEFGRIVGPVVASTTIHVTLEPASSGSQPVHSHHRASPEVPDLQMAVNDTVTVMLDRNKSTYATGLTLTPASGVLQFPTGRTHSPHLTLRAVAPGTVTVQYFGSGQRNAPCGTSSNNWSGYSIPGTPVTSITGSWVVPTINAGSPSGKSSTWIGIDGCAGEPQLIQTGTEQDMNSGFLGIGAGPSYNAWWQVLPQFGSSQSFSGSTPVFPGDVMTASITPVGGTPAPNTTSSWKLTLSDTTQGWSVSTTQSFNAPLDQAEWIQEATTWCTPFGCSVQELADYQTVTFDVGDTVAIAGGAAGNPGLAPVNAISMTPSTGDASNNFSTPSIPDCDRDGFTVVPSPIAPLPPGPSFPSASYPAAVVGTPYSQTISTLGAASVSLAGGTPPPGLTFSNGRLSGTPTATGTFRFTLSATDASGVAGATCTQRVTLSVANAPPPPTPTFSNVVITVLTGNDDLRNDSDLQVDFTGITGWPGNTCLVQGNSGNTVPGSACNGGTPGDWTGTFANNWGGWPAWSTRTETKSFPPGSLSFTGSGSITLTFSTHNTGCSIPFSGCGTSNDNWDIQAMKVDLTGSPVAPNSITLLNVGSFNAAHNSGGCFFRLRPPGANDPSSRTVTLTFPPSPAGNGCPND